MQFSARTLAEIDAITRAIFAIILNTIGDEGAGRTGGYLRIFLGTDPAKICRGWQELVSTTVGMREDWNSVKLFSAEKAIRLMKNYALHGHFTSFQTRVPENCEFGGAIIVRVNIPELGGEVLLLISFSGLPEKHDDTFDLLLVKLMQWGTDFEPILIASPNDIARRLLTT